MSSLAIIKPDHIGDLILSSAAINACANVYNDLTLYVGPWNLGLAKYLFPEIDTQPIVFQHLSKQGVLPSDSPDLRRHDRLLILRNDGIINRYWAAATSRRFSIISNNHDRIHQSALDRAAAGLIGVEYEPSDFFGLSRTEPVANSGVQTRIGLALGSGFYANRWPLIFWLETAQLLHERAMDVSFILGPSELGLVDAIQQLPFITEEHVVIGGGCPQTFLERISELTLVVASDGGTGHLCSLVVPVLSIFGPSPFQRYAPFGLSNYVLTRAMSCAPCSQYMSNAINGCTSLECMSMVLPADTLEAIETLLTSNLEIGIHQMDGGLQLIRGCSQTFRHPAARHSTEEH